MNTKKYEKIIEKEKKLTEEYLKYLKENYCDDDEIPDNDYNLFFEKNASKDVKNFERDRKNKYKKGIIVGLDSL